MKCPKCETENEQRSVCKKCGMFLYNTNYRNGPKLTEDQLKKRERAKIFGFFKRIGKVVWIIMGIILISFWLFVLFNWLFKLIGWK